MGAQYQLLFGLCSEERRTQVEKKGDYMMKREEITAKIKEIIGEVIGNGQNLQETEDLIESRGLRSIDAIRIIVMAEDIFQIEVKDEDLSIELVRTIEHLTNYVEMNII